MFAKEIIALVASVSSASAAVYQGFNYGSSTDFNTEFALAKSLAGTNGAFASARLYTSIEPNTANTPTSAIQAAISNDVTLLLGIWASAGQSGIDSEIAALKNAMMQHGDSFTSRVVGISVGSEDLYRISPTGVINKSGIGAEPADLISYIGQVRQALAGTGLGGVPIGHVDTWTAWVNGSNFGVTAVCDFIGMDAYPYFQTTQANGIENAYDLFFSAYDQTVADAQGKPVWVTETGWPASGPSANAAVPSIPNAETYWQQVACKLLGMTNTWWYTLNDNGAAPSFGVTTGSSTPLYNLACNAAPASSSSSSAAASPSTSSSTSSASVVVVSPTSSASAAVSTTSSAVSSPAATTASPSSSAAASTSEQVKSTPSNSIIPVTSSAVPSQAGGGSPGTNSTVGLPVSSSVSSVTLQTSTVIATSPTTSSNSTVTSATATPSQTGGAPAIRSTGGIIVALFAILAVL